MYVEGPCPGLDYNRTSHLLRWLRASSPVRRRSRSGRTRRDALAHGRDPGGHEPEHPRAPVSIPCERSRPGNGGAIFPIPPPDLSRGDLLFEAPYPKPVCLVTHVEATFRPASRATPYTWSFD